MEAALHDVAVQHVVQRDQAHALVVRHVGVDHDAAVAFALVFAGEIDGFVEAHRARRDRALPGVADCRWRPPDPPCSASTVA